MLSKTSSGASVVEIVSSKSWISVLPLLLKRVQQVQEARA